MNLNELVSKYESEIIEIRNHIHQYPEVGFEEIQTSQTVMNFLDKVGIPYVKGIAKTGVLATIVGDKPGKTVLLRADMDALAMDEDPGNPIVSKIAGRMHACGHDGHTAGLLLAGALLFEMKSELRGTVKLMFQPAEETVGGALPMIEEGVLEGVDMAFGCHLWGSALEGTAGYKYGAMMAAPDEFKITVTGKGGHGAYPQSTIDPIVAGAQIVTAIQSIVSRNVNPLESAVVTIATFHSGSAFNIISNEAIMTGTIRTLSEENRERVARRLKEIAMHVASAYGAEAVVEVIRKYPVLVNADAAVDVAKGAFAKILGDQNVSEIPVPSMGGEDFAYIAQHVPSAFVYVGIAQNIDKPISHHHPEFQWDDKNIAILGKGLAQCAIDFLNND
ncbi:MAG: amidohydrolase [Erysipelotrichaceae bacterium]|nr:amidohydrolase [Erysipelotrichaceae bacterium]